MKDFQEKRRWRNLLYSKLVVLVLAILFLLLARSVWGIWGKNRLTHARIVENEAKISALEMRRLELRRQVTTLATPSGVETALREKFSVVRPGERVVTIVDPEVATTTATTGGGLVGRLWRAVFD